MKKKNSLPIILTDNRDITISWLFVWARYKSTLTIHQLRLILRILEFCQVEIKGLKFKDNLRQLDYQQDDVVLRLPVTDVFFSDFSLKTIRDDLRNLRDSSIEFYDYTNKVWSVCGIIEKPHVYERTGMMEFKVDLQFWKVLLNLAHGIRKCELSKALSLPTPYSIWFYIFISEKSEPMDLTIDHLKERLGIAPDEYKRKDGKDRIDHIEDRILRPAQKALDELCPYTFRYEKIRVNPKSNRSPVKLLRFTPVYQPQFRDEHLEKKALIAKTSVSMINQQVYDYMIQVMGFELNELQTNKETLSEASRHIPDIMSKLSAIQGRRRKTNGDVMGIGWVINALKDEIRAAKEEKESSKGISLNTGFIGDLFEANR